jgi:large conductance mechanosensitive channel
MLKEFKEFALRGNVIDLAVAVILGIAFGAVITALVDGVLMNLIAALVGQPDFNSLSFSINGTPILYGTFLTALVNFLIVAFVLFLIIKAVNRATASRKPADDLPTVRECPFCLSNIPTRATTCAHCASKVEPVVL